MKFTYTTPNQRLTFEGEADTPKQAFENLAHFMEVFEEPGCGKCNSPNIRCNVREVEGNSYYEWVCLDCGARLALGQNKNMKHLFAKRKDENKQALAHRGWFHYGQTGGDEDDSRQQAPTTRTAPAQHQATQTGPEPQEKQAGVKVYQWWAALEPDADARAKELDKKGYAEALAWREALQKAAIKAGHGELNNKTPEKVINEWVVPNLGKFFTWAKEQGDKAAPTDLVNQVSHILAQAKRPLESVALAANVRLGGRKALTDLTRREVELIRRELPRLAS